MLLCALQKVQDKYRFCEDGSFLREMGQKKKRKYTFIAADTDRYKPDIHTRIRETERETRIKLMNPFDLNWYGV